MAVVDKLNKLSLEEPKKGIDFTEFAGEYTNEEAKKIANKMFKKINKFTKRTTPKRKCPKRNKL